MFLPRGYGRVRRRKVKVRSARTEVVCWRPTPSASTRSYFLQERAFLGVWWVDVWGLWGWAIDLERQASRWDVCLSCSIDRAVGYRGWPADRAWLLFLVSREGINYVERCFGCRSGRVLAALVFCLICVGRIGCCCAMTRRAHVCVEGGGG